MISQIVIFESNGVDNFYPFSIMHPIWEIRTGAFMIYEKYINMMPKTEINFFGRINQLNSFVARNHLKHSPNYKSDNTLFIDASVIPDSELIEQLFSELKENSKDILFEDKNEKPFALYIKHFSKHYDFIFEDEIIDLNKINDVKIKPVKIKDVKIMNYLWDSLDYVASSIQNDVQFFKSYSRFSKKQYYDSYAINESEIYIGKNVKIAPTVVIDASEGPVIIDDNAKIMPQSTIIGPCYIGKNCTIKIGAKIYEKNAFGDWCKLGGEIENSIIQSYSNKQHEGFLGHSYLCEWVNLGADTNCSDLKNTYSNITVNLNGKTVDTGRMFLGVLCGDHTKTGINSMFTTGTIAGICGILVRDWFLPNYIKSFSWGGKSDSPVYKVNKAIETAKIVMARRGKALLPEEEFLLKQEYERAKT